jgi:hypothetical protein
MQAQPSEWPTSPGYYWRWVYWLAKWEPVGVWQDGDGVWREEITCRRVHRGLYLPLAVPPDPIIDADRVWQI